MWPKEYDVGNRFSATMREARKVSRRKETRARNDCFGCILVQLQCQLFRQAHFSFPTGTEFLRI